MTDLVEFLLARIEEDERGARLAHWRDTGRWAFDPSTTGLATGQLVSTDPAVGAIASDVLPSDAQHMRRHDPARVLAECEAKRRIVQRYANGPHVDPDGALERHLACLDLASAYADHPDYDEAWRP